MNEETIRAQVIETLLGVAPDIDKGELDPTRSFRDQFDVDSVDFLNFVLSLEKKLGVEIPEADYPKLSSLDGCVSYFESVSVD